MEIFSCQLFITTRKGIWSISVRVFFITIIMPRAGILPRFLARGLPKAGRKTYFSLLTPTSDKVIDRTETDSVMQKASVPSSTAPADSSGVPLSTTTSLSSLHNRNKYHPPQRQARGGNCKEKRRPSYLISQ